MPSAIAYSRQGGAQLQAATDARKATLGIPEDLKYESGRELDTFLTVPGTGGTCREDSGVLLHVCGGVRGRGVGYRLLEGHALVSKGLRTDPAFAAMGNEPLARPAEAGNPGDGASLDVAKLVELCRYSLVGDREHSSLFSRFAPRVAIYPA